MCSILVRGGRASVHTSVRAGGQINAHACTHINMRTQTNTLTHAHTNKSFVQPAKWTDVIF